MSIDPYRVLGLHRDASVADIKQAYRRLAKAHHPDTAGDGATPRFLEIQAAYEMLVSPAERGRRTRAGATPAGGWRADPERARATREAWRARTRRTRPAEDPGRTGQAGTGGGSRPGRRGPADGPAPGGSRGRRRATLGSTSYDEADHEPFDPDWSGASWYGATSGTYWTINPKEYADPRKHGPEYQARGRRRTESDEPGVTSAGPDPEFDPADRTADEPAVDIPPADADGAAGDAVPPRRPEPRARAPRSDAGPAGARARPEAIRRPRFARTPGEVPPRPGPPPPTGGPPFLVRFLDDAGRSLSGRLILALAGWVPIGIVLAGAMGEGTGCARYLAECQGPFGAATVVGHGAVVLLLALLPRLAAIATLGTIAMLAAALPAAAALSAFGGARDPEGATPVFVVVLAAAWVAGIAAGILRWSRGSRPPPVP